MRKIIFGFLVLAMSGGTAVAKVADAKRIGGCHDWAANYVAELELDFGCMDSETYNGSYDMAYNKCMTH